ncbi:hypothetical protein SAY87_028230 [Trapa incisa]|uniref:Uncharacterized protein n=1 Tax=Trapa incisa TaxID=236973 RepID=A0AAN7L1P3_9MYRT|nr:hypothetical protein SAY87_028230 [Trapa incisa]
MHNLVSSSMVGIPRLPIVTTASLHKERHEFVKPCPPFLRVHLQPLHPKRAPHRLTAAGPVVLGARLQPITMKRPKQSYFAICSSSLGARCGAEQTQTVTREAPTITHAPTHIQERSPQLDDGGNGFPPRDGGDGGGGGGGGGNWSGGFFLFGFLAFLGFLKDMESEGESDSRRRG